MAIKHTQVQETATNMSAAAATTSEREKLFTTKLQVRKEKDRLKSEKAAATKRLAEETATSSSSDSKDDEEGTEERTKDDDGDTEACRMTKFILSRSDGSSGAAPTVASTVAWNWTSSTRSRLLHHPDICTVCHEIETVLNENKPPIMPSFCVQESRLAGFCQPKKSLCPYQLL